MNAYRVNESQLHKRRWPFVVMAATMLIVVLGVSGYFWLLQEDDPKQPTDTAIGDQTEKPQPESVVGHYLFNGTIVLARMVERAAGNDLAQPFSKMDSFEPDRYDAMTLDWECPTTEDLIPYESQIASLLFNCHKKWLPEVSKQFEIVSLANNHSNDLGDAAFLETQDNLEAAGIQTYGHFDPSVAEDACEIIGLPVRIQMPGGGEEQGRLPLAFCAWHYFSREPAPGEIEIMSEYVDILPVFGFMHAGVEYRAEADPNQVSIAHKLIDLGAEFVIGNSPHWVQNGEVYKGKPIFYSTGNFIFDQIDYETMRGLSVDVSIEIPYSENVAKWLALGEDCIPRVDTCLDEAKRQQLTKFDIALTYDIVGSSGGSRKITQKADAELQKAIEERVGWEGMKEDLGQQ